MLDFLNANKLKKEYEELKEKNNKLIKEKESLSDTISELRLDVENLSNKKKDLEIKLMKREEFFVETELKYIDTLSGLEFEEYCSNLLKTAGYETSVTKATQDNGGDILAEKDNTTYVVQCKHYSDSVGNRAIQEVYTAKGIYKGDVAIVMTNNFFTAQAQKEADILEVILWDRNYLKLLISTSYHFLINNIDELKSDNNNNRGSEVVLEEDEETDPLLYDAINIILDANQVSTSLLQRRLKIGYARAGKLVDELEKLGMISGYRGSKPREVFISKDTWNEMNKK